MSKLFTLLPAVAFLLAGCLTVPPHLPPPSEGNAKKWEKSIAAFETDDRDNPPPNNGILFIGSSSIRRWNTLAEDFPELPVYNRGFGGSQIADSLLFADRIVLPYRPRQIVMFAGSNDINAKKSPKQVLADFIAFRRHVHAALPDTRISFIAITPCEKRWSQLADVDEANRLVARYCSGDHRLDFIHTRHEIIGANGRPRPELFVADQLHLSQQGYSVWTRLIAPLLK